MKKERFFHKYRHWIQAAWFALTNGYLRGYTSGKIYTGNTKVLCFPGLNCYSCPGALGACPIGSLQAVFGSNTYRVSLYVFGVISLFGAVMGRLVCGFLCPFGLVQDLLYKIPFGPKRKNLPNHKILSKLRYVILILFVVLLSSLVKDVTGMAAPWFCEWICPSGTLFAGIPLVILNPGFRTAIGFHFWWKLAILLILLFLSVVYYRPFCKYLCPLGALYGVFNPVSTFRIKVDQTKCVKCGGCQRACGMDIRTFETPNSTECIRCLNCVSACPTGALDTTWHIAGKDFADRYLAKSDETLANPEVVRTVILGCAMVFSSLFTLLLHLRSSVYANFIYFMTNVYPASYSPIVMGMNFAKVTVTVLVLINGISLILQCKKADAVRSSAQSMKILQVIYLLLCVGMIIAIVLNPPIIGVWLNNILTSPFPLLGMPFITLTLSRLDKIVHGEKKAGIGFAILFVFTILVSLLIPLFPILLGYALASAGLTGSGAVQ